MSLLGIAQNAQLFFLIFTRVYVLLRTAPMLSSRGIPGIARIGLAMMTALVVYPWVENAGYPIPDTALAYLALIVGEGLIGIIVGLFLTLVFTTFQTAGQFFSLQMGFGAAQVFDPLSQVEAPLVGQLFNLMAMFVFIATEGFNRVFMVGVYRSFQAVRAVDVMSANEELATLMMHSLSALFQQALIISLPVLGTLLLVNISLGLMAKAAPQMNLLMLGFPAAILVAFLVMFLALPMLLGAFDSILAGGWRTLLELFEMYGGMQ